MFDSDNEDYEPRCDDYDYDDDNYYDETYVTTSNKQKLSSTDYKVVGYINKVPKNYFCYKWTINNIFHYVQSSQELYLQSPQFATGDNNENIWMLKLSADKIMRSFFTTDVQLILISYKYPSTYDISLTLMNAKNERVNEAKKVFKFNEVDQSKWAAEHALIFDFQRFINENHLYNGKIPVKNLTLVCEIINLPPKKMKISKYNKSDDLKLFLKSEKLSDITVSVGKTKFHLHKAILASRSTVFLAMFEHDMKENKENLIEITDVDEKIMKKVILYMYTDEIENLEEDVGDIFVIADKYGIEGLKSLCIKELIDSLSPDNAFKILALSDIYNNKRLQAVALDFIASNFAELVDMPGYKMFRAKYSYLFETILLTIVKKQRSI